MNDYHVRAMNRPVRAEVQVPGSKSITNRALMLAALCGKGATLHGALRCEDTEVMVDSLNRLGFHVDCDWEKCEIQVAECITGRKVLASQADLFVANSGTSMRFLAAICAVGEGRYRIDGVPRMRERPIQDLLDALNQLGVRARSEVRNGCPPIIIESNGIQGGQTTIRADISSQYLSALLMAAPFAHGDVSIQIEGPVVSEPYITMTLEMMQQWDLPLERQGNSFRIRAGNHAHSEKQYDIEPDASAASYFLAIPAIVGGTITVAGMRRNMLQGDVRFAECLRDMGCSVDYLENSIRVSFNPMDGRLAGIDVDMNGISDTVMTLAAVACFAMTPTTIRNVAHIRHKETDRITALAAELRKLGAAVEEFPDGLRITPSSLAGCRVKTYNDHRMAMSLALIGLRIPGVIIENADCVAKTYPGYWIDLEAATLGKANQKE